MHIMGIYNTVLECGCEIESYIFDVPVPLRTVYMCVAHGGNPIIAAGRQAQKWSGPETVDSSKISSSLDTGRAL